MNHFSQIKLTNRGVVWGWQRRGGGGGVTPLKWQGKKNSHRCVIFQGISCGISVEMLVLGNPKIGNQFKSVQNL
jgi:hypothetical protein